jgi:glycosyltransferase involved in cell wall biosynthesis
MNKGLKYSTGDVIMFLNSDDTYESENTIKNIISIFKYDYIDILYGNVNIYSKSNHKKLIRFYNSNIFTVKSLSYGVMPAHPATAIRSWVFKKLGGFNDSYNLAGDFDLIARAFTQLKPKYRYIDQVFVKMISGGKSDKLINKYILNKEIMRSCITNKIPSNYLKFFLRYLIKFNSKNFF